MHREGDCAQRFDGANIGKEVMELKLPNLFGLLLGGRHK